MSRAFHSTRRERRIDFHSEAPLAKHDYRFNQRPDIRMAGQVWQESETERGRRLRRENVRERSKNQPVYFDEYQSTSAPDNDYNTVEYIKRIPDQAR